MYFCCVLVIMGCIWSCGHEKKENNKYPATTGAASRVRPTRRKIRKKRSGSGGSYDGGSGGDGGGCGGGGCGGGGCGGGG